MRPGGAAWFAAVPTQSLIQFSFITHFKSPSGLLDSKAPYKKFYRCNRRVHVRERIDPLTYRSAHVRTFHYSRGNDPD